MRTKRRITLALLSLCACNLAAQDEMPAVPDEMPAVTTETRDPPATATTPDAAPAPVTGMTVIGEKEAPIGLYIMPWRQSQAATGLDRPARLLDEQLLPLDPEVFRRQVEYHRALSEWLEKTGRATP